MKPLTSAYDHPITIHPQFRMQSSHRQLEVIDCSLTQPSCHVYSISYADNWHTLFREKKNFYLTSSVASFDISSEIVLLSRSILP